MEEKIAFGAFLQKKRHEAGFTQRELAERLHVTESAVSKWERGVSYPDITLIPALCESLAVSERELITASEDFAQRRVEREARTLRRLHKGSLLALNVGYGVALLVCFIVTLAGPMRWGTLLVIFASLLTGASLTALPLLLPQDKRAWGTLGGFFAALNLLLGICALYTGGRWFPAAALSVLLGLSLVFLPFLLRDIPLPGRLARSRTLLYFCVNSLLTFPVLATACHLGGAMESFFPVAMPIALMGLALPWGLMLIIRYVPLRGLARAALCCVWAGLINPFINPAINTIADGVPFALALPNFSDWVTPATMNANIDFITTLVVWAVAAGLAIASLRRNNFGKSR